MLKNNECLGFVSMALHIFVSIYARAVDDEITFYIVH